MKNTAIMKISKVKIEVEPWRFHSHDKGTEAIELRWTVIDDRNEETQSRYVFKNNNDFVSLFDHIWESAKREIIKKVLGTEHK